MKRRIEQYSYIALMCALAMFGFADETTQTQEDETTIEEVVVSAHPYQHLGLIQSSLLLEKEDLARAQKDSLGATIAQLSGIHNNAFGEAVGRPVVQGLDGPRVRVMSDATSTMDIGVSYNDHPLLTETLLADRIELIKGATTLLYGSGAIGGVINTISGRFPKQIPETRASRFAIGQADNGSTRNIAFRQQLNASEEFLFHIDGFARDGDSYEIPGCPELHEEHEEHEEEEEEHEDEHEEEEMNCSVLENSDISLDGVSLGTTYFGSRGSVGVSFSTTNGNFGIPLHVGHGEEEHEEEEHEEEEHEDEHEEEHDERVEIDLEQSRLDISSHLQSAANPDLNLYARAGFSSYEHAEIEEDAIETAFLNDARDMRLEIQLPPRGELRQTYGLHHEYRDFRVLSDDRLDAESASFAVFALYRLGGQDAQYEFGARIGEISKEASGFERRNFSSHALSAGVLWDLNDQMDLGLTGEFSSRAPVIEELFTTGVHLATGSVERGDPDLENESLLGVSATLHGDFGQHSPDLTVYFRQFDDFIYSAQTGEVEDDLPVFQQSQDDVRFLGLDVTVRSLLYSGDGWNVHSNLGFDFVDASISGSSDDVLPRQPPARLRVALTAEKQDWTVGGTLTNVAEVTDVSMFESHTDGWIDLEAFVEYKRVIGDRNWTMSLRGRNLTDEEQRLHVSPIKDRILQRGRSLDFSVRISER